MEARSQIKRRLRTEWTHVKCPGCHADVVRQSVLGHSDVESKRWIDLRCQACGHEYSVSPDSGQETKADSV